MKTLLIILTSLMALISMFLLVGAGVSLSETGYLTIPELLVAFIAIVLTITSAVVIKKLV